MVKRSISLLLAALCVLLVACNKDNEKMKTNDLDDAVEITDKAFEEITDEATQTPETNAPEEIIGDPEFQTDEVTEAEPEAPERNEALPLAGKKICVDAGHGVFAKSQTEPIGPGSSTMKAAFVSGTAGSYQSEAEFNLKVALLVEELLAEYGAEVFMTRTDENAILSNVGRAELGNDNNCVIAVRIHADGSTNTSVKGISMLVPARNEFITDDYILEESEKAGEIVLDSVIEKTSAIDLGIIYRADLTGFNWSEIPSILIECGFMSNPEEDAKLADPNYQKLIAEGIVEGLIEYFN